MSKVDEVKEELAKVTSVVLTARKLLAGGTLLDLAAVEERVRQLCELLSELPKREATPVLDDTRALIERLGRLEDDLREQIERLKHDAEE